MRDPEGGGTNFLWNIVDYLLVDTAQTPRRLESSANVAVRSTNLAI
jgi:hypothetical protein